MLRLNRRSFLKKSATAATVVAGTSAFANIIVPRQKDKLGVALVGLGYYSTDILAPALQLTRNCELTGIVTGSPEKIPVWQDRYGIADANVYNYENMHTIENNEAIDVIYIVLPTGLHSKYSVIAAEAGKHVWCEKPMARTVAECQSIIDACRKNKRFLSIGYRMQHEPNTQTVMEWAKSKPYGSIQTIKAEAGYREGRRNHWKMKKDMGGGAMYDMGVYPLNAARYSSGEEPIAVTARHENERKEMFKEVDETTYFKLEFPSGATANCMTSFGRGANELRIDCEKGWYELKPFQAYNGVKGRASDGTLLNKTVNNQQANQMDNDARAIQNNTKPLVPGEEGLKDIAIVEKVYESAAKGERVTL
jgi:glucose-fructose oxidoreductase